MAKTGLSGATIKGVLNTTASTGGWTLCIGAGTSRGPFPTWDELVVNLVSAWASGRPAGSPTYDPNVLTSMLRSEFSADALIHATQEYLGLDDSKFWPLLTTAMYARLRATLTPAEWKIVARVFNAKGPGSIEAKAWDKFSQIRADYFSGTSASQIADVVAPTLGTNHGPTRILSFNAEPLLFALLNHSVRMAIGAAPLAGMLAQPMDLVTRSTSNVGPGRVPYAYCHGLLAIPDVPSGPSPFSSLDKLVFSETQYLSLSNQSYSWQASTFLSAAAASRIVFVGVSLSDSNMRRWLSWAHAVRQQELFAKSKYSGDSTQHFWLRTRPNNPSIPQADIEHWVEACVAHLGVRLVWLDDWADVGPVLQRMLGH